MKTIRIGTRGSALALAQANWVKRQIQNCDAEVAVEIIVIKTSGDRFVDAAIQAMGGKGVFTKEIEEALLRREVDLAVHSMKDLPTDLAPGLVIAAVPKREDPRDVLIASSGAGLSGLPSGATVATGSLRRQAQLRHYRSDLSLVPIRGNVDTRLKKLDAGEVDALIMAAAGLKRLGREDRITEFVSPEICVSAVAQGALALEALENGAQRNKISFLHDPTTCAEVTAERAFLKRLGGGCHVPVGARAQVDRDNLSMKGVVAHPDGSALCGGTISGRITDAAALGQDLAERLLGDGADKILAMNQP
ncbi:MAG: hydroxymethylbilane synthase [Deltaproteobacteria bacterium]